MIDSATSRWLNANGYRRDVWNPPWWFKTVRVGNSIVRLAARIGEPCEDVRRRERKVVGCG